MMMIHKLFACSLIFLFSSSQQSLPQTQPSSGNEDSCRKFVQQFYEWYLPKAKTAKVRPADIVMKYKSAALSPELLRRLRADSAAQAKARAEIVGLDFDPFLNTQDPDFERCTVGKVVSTGKSCRADVSCVFPGQNADKSSVAPELEFQQGRWLFVNFHYRFDSKDDDLLHILKNLQAERHPKSK